MIEEEQIIDIIPLKKMTALDFIVSLRPFLPMSVENPCTPMSNGEARRLLDQSAVLINGKKPKSKEFIDFPVKELVWFPKNPKKRVTMF
ncbi:MAG TPA: hypothetical protein VFM18_07220 [Methanosarcina sp.]|nr:hypothetical protein [Methanosarcina sp.]